MHLRSWTPWLEPGGVRSDKSPLMEDEPDEDGWKVPLMPPHFFVTGLWAPVARHLAVYSSALVARRLVKPHDIPVLVINDLELVEVRFARNSDERFSTKISAPGFVVLRLGVQTTRNEELPNIVWETCRIRETRRQPIVLVNEPFTPWGSGHRCFSPELDRYLGDRFHRVAIR